MPIIHRAIKKLKHDRLRAKKNEHTRNSLERAVKTARVKPTQKSLSTAYTALDKAVKLRVIHKNKASRLKSRLAKRLK